MNIPVRREFALYLPAGVIPQDVSFITTSDPASFVASNGQTQQFYQLSLQLKDGILSVPIEEQARALRWSKKASHEVEQNRCRFTLSIEEGIFNFRKVTSILARIVLYEFNAGANLWHEVAHSACFNIVSKNNRSALIDTPFLWLTAGIPTSEESSSEKLEMLVYESSNSPEYSYDSESYELLSRGNAEVCGNIRALNFYRTSDQRFKINIQKLSDLKNPREILCLIDGVHYELDPLTFPEMSSKKHIGYLAQQIQQHIPDAVTFIDGILHVDYTAVIPFISESVKSIHHDTNKLQDQMTDVTDWQAQVKNDLLKINQYLQEHANEVKKTTHTENNKTNKSRQRRSIFIGITSAVLLSVIVAASLLIYQTQNFSSPASVSVPLSVPKGDNNFSLQCPSECQLPDVIKESNLTEIRDNLVGVWVLCNQLTNVIKTNTIINSANREYLTHVTGLTITHGGALQYLYATYTLYNGSAEIDDNQCPQTKISTTSPKYIVKSPENRFVLWQQLSHVPLHASYNGYSLILSPVPFESALPELMTVFVRTSAIADSFDCSQKMAIKNMC